MNGAASPFSFWSSAAPWLALVAFALTVWLLRARPAERATYLNTLWLFLVGIGGEAAASPAMPTRNSHSVLRNVARSCGRACSSAMVRPNATSASHGAAELQNENGVRSTFPMVGEA